VQQAFERIGIPLRQHTLCDWVGWCSDQVSPILTAMGDFARAQALIQNDETTVRIHLPDGQMQTARLRASSSPTK